MEKDTILKNLLGATLCCSAEIEGDTTCGKPGNVRVNGRIRCRAHAGGFPVFSYRVERMTGEERILMVAAKHDENALELLSRIEFVPQGGKLQKLDGVTSDTCGVKFDTWD